MNLFDLRGAEHYCQSYGGMQRHASASLVTFVRELSADKTKLTEGTPEFDEFRDCALRHAERHLLLAASLYRRALDLMIPSSAPWAHVTLYYGAFHAAQSFLAMFGGWCDGKRYVEVTRSAPGNQQLKVVRRPQNASGTHRLFWREFYAGCSVLQQWMDPSLSWSLQPVNNDPDWLIQRRNDVNYNSAIAVDLATNFANCFNAKTFPLGLPGAMITQYRVCEALLLLGASSARDLGLCTDALDALCASTGPHKKLNALVYMPRAPSLVRKTRKADVVRG